MFARLVTEFVTDEARSQKWLLRDRSNSLSIVVWLLLISVAGNVEESMSLSHSSASSLVLVGEDVPKSLQIIWAKSLIELPSSIDICLSLLSMVLPKAFSYKTIHRRGGWRVAKKQAGKQSGKCWGNYHTQTGGGPRAKQSVYNSYHVQLMHHIQIGKAWNKPQIANFKIGWSTVVGNMQVKSCICLILCNRSFNTHEYFIEYKVSIHREISTYALSST